MIIRRLVLVLVPAVIGVNLLVMPANADTAVSPDLAFGSAGVATDASMTWLTGTQPAVVSNSTYFIGGHKTATPQVVGVDAYDLNGQPVTTYGTAGLASVNTGAANFFATGFTATSTTVDDIGADSTGRVLVAGSATGGPSTYFFVLRFNAAGVLDPTFATGGVYAASTIGTGNAGPAWIDTNPDGTSAVRVDVTTPSSNEYFFKLSAAGVRDPSYGSAGLATSLCTGSNAFPWIDLRPGGDVFTDCFTSGGQLQVSHLLANGLPEPVWGGAGVTQIPDNGLGVSDLVDRPGGGYYLAGLRGLDSLIGRTGAQARPMLVALNADGTLDTSFGTGGVAILPNTTLSAPLSFSALTMDSTGRLLALASGEAGTSYLLRYSASGVLDPAFGASAGYQTLAGSPSGWSAAFISAPSASTVVAYQATGLRRLVLADPAAAAAAPLASTGPRYVTTLLELGIALTLAGCLLLTVRRRGHRHA